MRQLFAFRRSLRFIALALCSVSIVAFVTPASARPHHGAGRHARAYHAGHHAKHHYAYRDHRHAIRTSRWDRSAQRMQAGGFADTNPSFMESSPQMVAPGGFGSPSVVTEARADRGRRGARLRQVERTSRWERGVAQMQARGLANVNASVATDASVATNASAGANSTVTPAGGAMASSFSSSNVVATARRYLGGNPTGRGSLWCARFMNMVLQHSGYRGTGSDMASSFSKYGQRVSGPQVGAIAVMTRGRRGGHVGVITGIDAKGNPIMISGNNGNRVREAPVSRGRIYAYVMPTS
jgi:uncharacterized protein (TIGR02594 family)